MWRMFRDARILGTIGVLFFVAVIAGLNATVYSPEATVLRYLNALEDGRQADVAALVWGDSGSLAYDVRVPTDPADRPHSIRVTKVSNTADSSIVLVAYELGGVTRTTTFGMRKESSWSPLADWRFAVAPIATVNLDSRPIAPFGVNGSLPGESGATYVPAIAQVASGTSWFEADSVAIAATNPAAVYFASLTFTPTAQLASEIDMKVRDYLDACAKQKTLVPKKCPFAGFAAQKIAKGPVWTMVTYPKVTISEVGGAWQVSGEGSVKLDVSLVDFATEKTEKYSEVLSFQLSGTIAGLTEGKPRLVVENTVER